MQSFEETWIPRRLRLMARDLLQRMDRMDEDFWLASNNAENTINEGPPENTHPDTRQDTRQEQYLFLMSLEAFEQERRDWLNGMDAREPTWLELGY